MYSSVHLSDRLRPFAHVTGRLPVILNLFVDASSVDPRPCSLILMCEFTDPILGRKKGRGVCSRVASDFFPCLQFSSQPD